MGILRDTLNKIKTAAVEAAERQRAEQAALRERMRPYCRGYDVYPDEVNSQYCSYVRRCIIRNMLIKLIFLALIASAALIFRKYELNEMLPLLVIAGVIVLILLAFVLADLSMLSRYMKGNYDCFGAMVTNTRVESQTSTDSDGQTTTTYDYYVTLNGIECEVNSKEYNKVSVGQYIHFVRLKSKYRKNDRFYFFPSSADEEHFLIGHHNPTNEPRLYAPEKGSTSLTILSVLCIAGAVAAFIWVCSQGFTEDSMTSLMLPGGFVAGALVISIINKLIGLGKERRKLEELQRNYHGQ